MPNIGLSGIYEPGTLVQTTQADTEGKSVALASPIVFAWSSDCFPNLKPHTSPFVLANSKGSQTNSISLGANLVNLFIPSLKLGYKTVENYRLDLENPQVYTLAKSDLSRQFSEKCVTSLANALEDGDKIEWFQVINEAVIVDALTLEISWKSEASATGRSKQRDGITQQLGLILSSYRKNPQVPEAELKLVIDNEKKSVIKTSGAIIIGYRSRPLQPVYEK